MLHQVTYDTVLKRSERELHAKVAPWLAGSDRGSARATSWAPRPSTSSRPATARNAAEFHARAAEHAGSASRTTRVLAHVERALALLGDDAARRASPSCAGGCWRCARRRWTCRRDRDEQRADLDALDALADVLDDDRRRAYAAWRRSLLAHAHGRPGGEESAARQAWPVPRGPATTSCGCTRCDCWRWRSVSRATSRRAGRWRSRAWPRREAWACAASRRGCSTCSRIAAMQGDLVGALELDRQNLLICRETGDRRSEAIAPGQPGRRLAEAGRPGAGAARSGRGAAAMRGARRQALEAARCRACRRWRCGKATRRGRWPLARPLDIAVAAKARDFESGGLVPPGRRRTGARPQGAGGASLRAGARAWRRRSTARSSTTPARAWRGWRWPKATPAPRCGPLEPLLAAHRAAPAHAGRHRTPAPDRTHLPPGPGPRRRPARCRVAGPRPRRADGPGAIDRRPRAAPGLPAEHPAPPRDRGGVGGARREPRRLIPRDLAAGRRAVQGHGGAEE